MLGTYIHHNPSSDPFSLLPSNDSMMGSIANVIQEELTASI